VITGWGDPDGAVALDPELRSLLRSALGIARSTPALAPQELRPPPSRLAAAARDRLRSVTGQEHLRQDALARLGHTRGKSTVDLLRIRTGDASDAPDAVIEPGSHEQVLELLRVCEEHRLVVVPYGGGTSVVGGLAPVRGDLEGVVALDLGRLDRLLELDEISRTATLEAGLRGPAAERLLARRGYTLAHRPQSFEFASVGGFAATRSSGQASAGYGRFDERVVGLRIATPRGTLELGRAPKSAAGPDLRQLFLGSEGAFGVITSVRVEVDPRPEAEWFEGWRFASFAEGIEALRALAQDGPTPAILRLSDEVETALNERPAGQGDGGCVAITGYAGARHEVEERRQRVAATLGRLGARREPAAGETWLDERLRGPYLRDALLDAGALVETLETATFWSGLPALYGSVRDSLAETLRALGTPPVVLCHLSHTYRSGASLYFTVAAAQLDDPVSQWRAAKSAAGDAILAAGGTISHHHGVGVDHREQYGIEIAELGAEILQAVKATLDPRGILNPGVMVPRVRGGG
jgi:alkyldihydroxyacetonephosphate synthase